MTRLLVAEQLAIAEIEDALQAAGWSDGYGLTDAEIKNAPSPLFYRNSTPKSAADSRVIIDGVGRTVYLVYKVLRPEAGYADNVVHHINETIALAIYSSDAYTFYSGSKHERFLSALLSELADRDYVISMDGDGAEVAASDREPYIYRRVLYATKII